MISAVKMVEENLRTTCQLRGNGMCVSVVMYAQGHFHFIYMQGQNKVSHHSAVLKPHRLMLCLHSGICVYLEQFNYKLFITN